MKKHLHVGLVRHDIDHIQRFNTLRSRNVRNATARIANFVHSGVLMNGPAANGNHISGNGTNRKRARSAMSNANNDARGFDPEYTALREQTKQLPIAKGNVPMNISASSAIEVYYREGGPYSGDSSERRYSPSRRDWFRKNNPQVINIRSI